MEYDRGRGMNTLQRKKEYKLGQMISSDTEEEDCLIPGEENLNLRIEQNMNLFSMETLRRCYFWGTQIVGLLIVCLTIFNIYHYCGGFGGRAYPKLLFNWHQFFMVLGFTYFFANALTVFRLMPLMSKPKLKLVHLGLNGAVVICACLGLFFVIDERGIQEKAHFQSLHSWIGLFTILLLVIQFVCGSVVYLSPKIPLSIKEAMMPWHIKIGISAFMLGVLGLITGLKKGGEDGERLFNKLIGVLILVFCFFILSIMTDGKYRFNYRLR